MGRIRPEKPDVFLQNTLYSKVVLALLSGRSATDVLDDAVFEATRGTFEVRMKPRTIRMLALSSLCDWPVAVTAVRRASTVRPA